MWMRTLTVVTGLMVVLCLGGCKDKESTTSGDPSTEKDEKSKDKKRKKKSATKAPSAGAASLAALPAGGVIYGSGSLAILDVVSSALPAEKRGRAEKDFLREFGVGLGKRAEVATALGIDDKRPILFGMVGPPHEGIEKLVAEAIAAKDQAGRDKAQKKVATLTPPPFVKMRLVVPLASSGDDKILQAVEKWTHGDRYDCPSDNRCKNFKDAPKAIFVGSRMRVAAYADQETTTLDVVFADSDESDERAFTALATFHANTGGPVAGQCTELSAGKGTALCFDPKTAADGGVGWGLTMVMWALQGGALDSEQKVKILKVGQKEALQARALLALKPMLLSDGTFAIRQEDGKAKLVASWQANDDGAKRFSKFEESECAKAPTGVAALFSKLRRAAGVDEKRDRRLSEQFQEAGWAGWAIVGGGTWPALLPFIEDAAKEIPTSIKGEVCIRFEDKRLYVESEVEPASLFGG